MSYWVAMVARNSKNHIQSTLNSLLNQSLKPERIIIIDDGSTDGSEKLLGDYARRFPHLLKVVTLPDKGYDIRRVPSNINLACKTASASGLETDYLMISGDDCAYSKDYCRVLVSRMSRELRLVVASGRPSSEADLSQEQSPAGSGRFIRSSFWRKVGGGYPLKAGWETWLLYRALQMGYLVNLFPELTFEHARPRGAKHQFVYWGAAMHALGYLTLYALGRIAKNVVTRKVTLRGSVNMIRGYLLAVTGSEDPFISPFDRPLRDFVRAEQVRKVRRLVRALTGRFV